MDFFKFSSRSRQDFVYVLEGKQHCWKKFRFPAYVQLRVVPIAKF